MHVINLAQKLSFYGHEVHLIYSPIRLDQFFLSGLSKIRDGQAVPLAMARGPSRRDLPCIKLIRKYLKEHGPFDILHGHSSKGGALLRLAGIGLPGAKIYTPHALITQDPSLSGAKRLFFESAEKILAKFTDGFIAETDEEEGELRRLGVPLNKIVIIPNGLEPPNLPDRATTRARLKVSEDEVVIGFIGRFCTQKGPEIIIQAMASLVERFQGQEITLLMVGDGELRQKLHQMARRLEIAPRVRWMGEVPWELQMPAFDLFTVPSLYEAMPYVLLEALFAGLPIVATQVGGAKLLVEPEVNGYLVPPGDPQSLARALGELIVDPSKRSKFGKASLKKSQFFTLDTMTSRIQSLYYKYLGNGDETANA
jgi:glycosyltransferase involved in cell wall biosynthesis